MKISRPFYSFIFFVLFFSFSPVVFADATTGLAVTIATNGDIHSVSVNCQVGHAYTLTLIHEIAGSVTYDLGSIERVYCSGPAATFQAFNLNTLLVAQDPAWWHYTHTPLEFIIKDTTAQGMCDANSCTRLNEFGAFNSYDYSVELASSTYWTTIGAGPIFDTTDNVTWANIANGDGSANYVPADNVLFLPGIEASRLYLRGVLNCVINCEDQLWEPNADSDAEALYLNPDGTSSDDRVYTRDVVNEAYGTVNVYKSFLTQLATLKTAQTITDYSAVPYDWRLSLDDILTRGATSTQSNLIGPDDLNISYTHALDSGVTAYILSELTRLASSSPSGKVTIVAHSNGGLVAKALLKKLADTNSPLLAKVDKLVLVAVPQLGTPIAVGALLHGYDQVIPLALSENVARGLAENSPGAYNLLPSANYLTNVATAPVTIDGVTLPQWNTHYGSTVNSQSSLHYFLTDTFGRVASTNTNTDSPDNLSESLLANAEAVHTALDAWTAPNTMQVYEIAGWGVPSTVSQINYKSNGDDLVTITPDPKFTVDGDGTVVVPSAMWTNGASEVKYWVNLKEYNKDHNYQGGFGLTPFVHRSITEVPQLREVIQNIITSSPQTPLPQYITTTSPSGSSTDTRLVYTLRSNNKSSLNLYDNLGNHTGISTTTGKTEENIPGTYFSNIGGVTYVFTPASTGTATSTYIFITLYPQGAPTPTEIQPHTDTSGGTPNTFTFNVTQIQGDTTVATTTFKDIPIDATTTVSVDIVSGVSTLSPMYIDTNSDGSPETILVPIVDGVVTMPVPIVVSTQTTTSASGGSSANASNGPIVGSGGGISAPVLIVPFVSTTTTEVIKNNEQENATTVSTIFKPLAVTKELKTETKQKIPIKTEPESQAVGNIFIHTDTVSQPIATSTHTDLLAQAGSAQGISGTMILILSLVSVSILAVIIYLL